MPDGYAISLRSEVEDDLRPIGRLHRRRVLDAIEERLTSHPDQYGKPLGGRLSGLRRVRVGDFRIVYQIKDDQVIVWAAIHRKNVYIELAKRILSPGQRTI